MIDDLAPTFGNSTLFSGALIVFFSVFGFVGGWLITSLRLPRALEASHAELLFIQAAEAIRAGDTTVAKEKAEEAIAELAGPTQ